MHSLASTLKEISIDDLVEYVNENYSQSSARVYLSVLKQLKIYGGGYLSPLGIDSVYVEGFRGFLAERFSPASISQYLRSLRSLLGSYLGPEYRAGLKEAFAALASTNETDTRCINVGELLKVGATSALLSHAPLDKARHLFMLSALLGGVQLPEMPNALKSVEASGRIVTRSGCLASVAPQALDAIARFHDKFGSRAADYAASLDADSYARCLDAIGSMLRLKHPLLPKSSADGWVAMARRCGIPARDIAAAVNGDVALMKYVAASPDDVDTTRIEEAYRTVADCIESRGRHWYGMRCFGVTPDDVKNRLTLPGDGVALGVGESDVYIPASDGSDGCDKVMCAMLFFRATSSAAISIKRLLGPEVYVYSYRSGEKVPAIISDAEMMTFMLLARVAGDSIRCYFPGADDETPDFEVDDTVTITDGAFSGLVGVVEKTSRDTLRVVVRISGLCAVVTAEVPKKFLRRVGDKA